MKVSTVQRKGAKVQSPQSTVQSDGGSSRAFSHFGRRALDWGLRPSRFGDRDGIALVITLIMLSIITFMAVTFLVLSQRERSSVSTALDQKIARDASDAAFSRVSVELLTRMMAHTNFQDFDLLVSTNYINYEGLNPTFPAGLSATNVNYDYLNGGGYAPLANAQDRELNIANLLYNPRPPVYVVTNTGTGQGEFRYYLDLNRNGRFDRNGNWPIVFTNGANAVFEGTNSSGVLQRVPATFPTPVGTYIFSNNFVGDPEWIGVLERPLETHSADNRFISRYAYLVVPAGKTLDVNTMHNQAVTKSVFSPANDGYLRNQGVGPWELNLAAFLVDLNTNVWDANPFIPQNYYQYNEGDVNSPFFGQANKGLSFQDAFSILSYRYAGDYNSLIPANALFRTPGALTFDNIDEYSDGPLMTGVTNIAEVAPSPQDVVTAHWLGAENTNHYFSQQDLFNRGMVGANFAARLQQVGTNNDSYNAYTFYRLLSQLGTDSTPDETKVNVNFKNTDIHGQVVNGMETNMNTWTALDFFTNAATAMFQQMNMRDFNGNLITITNIPIYEDPLVTGVTNLNYYTPAVHRVLQMAANIVDATVTNRFIGAGPTNYPSVFRPMFTSHNGIVYVSGYLEVNNTSDAFLPMLEVTNVVRTPQVNNAAANIYGLPWVIGVKKGFPNFNEFSMENPLMVSRKLTFTNSVASRPWTTNQVFDFAITNSFGLEAWNSYTNLYGRPLRLVASNELTITVTNETGTIFINALNIPYGVDQTISSWTGWTEQLTDNSFKVPLYAASIFTNGIYDRVPPFFHQVAPPFWTSTFVPHLWMNLSFKLRFLLIDTTANRIVDFVNIASVQPTVDLEYMLNHNNPVIGHWVPDYTDDGEWNTNLINGTTLEMGILNQIEVSKADHTSIWTDPQRNVAGPLFNHRLLNGGTNYFEAPFTPHRAVIQRISFQANDPLVHYTASDLTNTNGQTANYNVVGVGPLSGPPLANLTNLNQAYLPWGGRHLPDGGSQNNNQFDADVRVKDPLIQQSDNWNFPTNRLPNIGWLGRVHRGTPWQTVFMKPSSLTPAQWQSWSGDNVIITNGNKLFVDSVNTRPTDDYRLFDLFTASLNPSAARGQLDVNQTNLAAWSAVLSGVNVLSNANTGMFSMVINPAGVYNPTNPSPVAAIVQGILRTKSVTNAFNNVVFANKTFQHAGDILATPELTLASPFLNTNGLGISINRSPYQAAAGITDEMMERIPQQIMSLLTLNQSPRFVIYSFGQTLHPAADHPLVNGGALNGLCTNYQITAESATRAVVRVEGSPDPQYTNDVVHPHPDAQGRFYPPHLVVEQFNVLSPD